MLQFIQLLHLYFQINLYSHKNKIIQATIAVQTIVAVTLSLINREVWGKCLIAWDFFYAPPDIIEIDTSKFVV